MFALTLVVALMALLAGVALGWYLHRANRWCQQCGDVLTCGACRARSAWTAPGMARRNSQ